MISTVQARQSVGILGGSFDPVHRAHLELASSFAEILRLDSLRFLPAGQPWQKNALSASGPERLKMLQLALAGLVPGHCRYSIDARELQRSGPTFTIDTLRELRAELGPDCPLVFLIGADQLLHLDTWKDWQEMWSLAHIAAASRPGFGLDKLPRAVQQVWQQRQTAPEKLHETPAGHAFLLDGLMIDISATAIRESLAEAAMPGGEQQEQKAAALLPHAVLEYIETRHLYTH